MQDTLFVPDNLDLVESLGEAYIRRDVTPDFG